MLTCGLMAGKAQELLCGVRHPGPLARQWSEEDLCAAVMLQVRFQAWYRSVSDLFLAKKKARTRLTMFNTYF